MLKQFKEKLFSEITSTPDLLKANRLPGLDGLRGVAIIIVILSHLAMDTPFEKCVRGEIGVKIFFVLSGFLITTLLLKEKIKTKTISLKQFYIRRFLRIMPLVFLYLSVVLILNYFLDLGMKPAPFASAIFFFQNLHVPGINTGNWYIRHFWSLSVEEQFYITFPFLLVYDLNRYIKAIVFLIIGVSFIGLLGFNKVGVFYSNAIIHRAAFVVINFWESTVSILIGSLLSILIFKQIIVGKNSLFTRWLSLLLFVVAVLVHTDSSIFFINYSTLFLFPSLIGIVIVLNLNTYSVFTKILEFAPLKYIGLISYSLYMWQQLFSKHIVSVLHTNSVLLRIAVIFITGAASYHFYEFFFIKLKTKFEPGKTGKS